MNKEINKMDKESAENFIFRHQEAFGPVINDMAQHISDLDVLFYQKVFAKLKVIELRLSLQQEMPTFIDKVEQLHQINQIEQEIIQREQRQEHLIKKQKDSQ